MITLSVPCPIGQLASAKGSCAASPTNVTGLVGSTLRVRGRDPTSELFPDRCARRGWRRSSCRPRASRAAWRRGWREAEAATSAAELRAVDVGPRSAGGDLGPFSPSVARCKRLSRDVSAPARHMRRKTSAATTECKHAQLWTKVCTASLQRAHRLVAELAHRRH